MIANLEEIISQAHNDLPEAGVVINDCDQRDTFYVPKLELEKFKEKLADIDSVRFEKAQSEFLHHNNVLVVTFHNQHIIDITLYDENKNLSEICPLEQS